jgi:hypothetical protein
VRAEEGDQLVVVERAVGTIERRAVKDADGGAAPGRSLVSADGVKRDRPCPYTGKTEVEASSFEAPHGERRNNHGASCYDDVEHYQRHRDDQPGRRVFVEEPDRQGEQTRSDCNSATRDAQGAERFSSNDRG